MKTIIPRENTKLENIEKVLIIAKKPLFFPLIERKIRKIWQNFPLFYKAYNDIRTKDVNYLIGFLHEELKARFPIVSLDLLTEPGTKDEVDNEILAPFKETVVYPRDNFKNLLLDNETKSGIKRKSYDLVVIIYPDAVGVGCLNLDLFALSISVKNVSFIIKIENGLRSVRLFVRNVKDVVSR